MADAKPPCLTVLGGPMAGTRFVLQDGVPNVLIGSDPVCAFHLPLPGVSAMHARIAVEPGGVSLCEAGSDRALHVNDSRVSGSALLRNGDIIWLGTPGDPDVVMLQCILPRLPSLEGADASAATVIAPAVAAAAVEGETVALDPQALSLDAFASPGEAPPADVAEPMPLVVQGPAEPEEAGVIVDTEAQTLIRPPETAEPLDVQQDFVVADESATVIVDEAARPYVPPPPPPPPVASQPIVMPPGFEDETEDRLVEASTVIVAPDQVAEPTAFLPPTEAAPPPPTPPVAPARSTPPAPTPPTPAARPAAPAPRPASRPASMPPTPRPPGLSQRTTPAARPSAPAAPARAKAKSSSPTGLYVGLGLGAIVVLGGAAFAVMKLLPKGEPKPVAVATPAPALPTAAPTPVEPAPPPPTDAPPVVEETVETVPTVVATPTPSATPTGRPTPSPSPTKAATPAATPTPAQATGPSPDQVRAQQVAGLLGQADAALAARQFDQAVGHYDEVLRLEPGHAKATADRAAAIAARDMARRRFVAGRTVVTTEKEAGGGLSGFEGAAVQKAPDFLGRIEFEMSPASGLKPGDPWTLKFYVVNEGKKAIRITDLSATAVVNGERSAGAASARAREVAPQQRVQVGEMSGAWKDGTQAWSAEVLVTAKGDSLKNTLTWR